jgi:hypothetical protein
MEAPVHVTTDDLWTAYAEIAAEMRGMVAPPTTTGQGAVEVLVKWSAGVAFAALV